MVAELMRVTRAMKNNKIEFRHSQKIKITHEDKKERTISAVTATVDRDFNGYRFSKEAFNEFLGSSQENILMYYNHNDDNLPIGVWTGFTLNDNGELIAHGEFADTTEGRDAFSLVSSNMLNSVSIGGYVKDFDFTEDDTFLMRDFNIREVSIVQYPANPDAIITEIKHSYNSKPNIISVLDDLLNEIKGV